MYAFFLNLGQTRILLLILEGRIVLFSVSGSNYVDWKLNEVVWIMYIYYWTTLIWEKSIVSKRDIEYNQQLYIEKYKIEIHKINDHWGIQEKREREKLGIFKETIIEHQTLHTKETYLETTYWQLSEIWSSNHWLETYQLLRDLMCQQTLPLSCWAIFHLCLQVEVRSVISWQALALNVLQHQRT